MWGAGSPPREDETPVASRLVRALPNELLLIDRPELNTRDALEASIHAIIADMKRSTA